MHQRIGGLDDAAEDGFIADDLDVAGEIWKARQSVIQRYEVTQAVNRFEFVEAQQLVSKRDAVDAFAALMQFQHAPVDAAVLFQTEIIQL